MTPVAAASSVLIVVFFNSVVAQVNFSGAVNACFSGRISIIGISKMFSYLFSVFFL
jgi:hypothetical protein